MKTIIVYYSYSGNTKKAAQNTSLRENADLYEITDKKRPSKVQTYLIAALNRKQEINPIRIDLSSYERIIVMAPLWGIRPAPAINNIFEKIPDGRNVEVVIVGADKKPRESLYGAVEKITKSCNLLILKFDYISM